MIDNFKWIRKAVFILLLLSLSNPTILKGQNSYKSEIKSIAEKLSNDVSLAKKKRLAVIDFTDLEGNITALGRFIAEKMSVALFRTTREFDLVNRSQLARLIKENKLAEEGLLNPKTVARLGQLAGVDAIIIGTLTPFGDNIEYSVSAINIESATIIAAIDGQFPKTNAMNALLDTPLLTSNESPSQENKNTTPETDSAVKINDLTEGQLEISEWLDVSGKKSVKYDFILTKRCTLEIQLPSSIGFTVNYLLSSDRGTRIKSSGPGTQALVQKVELPAGKFTFTLTVNRGAGIYTVQLKTYCTK